MGRFLLAAVAGLMLGGPALRADEVKVELDKLPKAVLETVKKRFPKAELKEAAKETEGDKVEYEVSLVDGKTKYDVILTPEGKLTLIEKTIDAKSLPEAVLKAIEEKYPKSKIVVAEEMYKVGADGKETLDYYEALLDTADKKKIELEIGTDAKIKKTEEKSKEKEEKDEKSKDKK